MAKPEAITIYHNPRCSKSRQALALIEESGFSPTIVRYLETPPSAAELRAILGKLQIGPRGLLRRGESVYKTLGLDDEQLTDAQIISAMVEHPVLIERPIVVADGVAVIGRPPERVLDLIRA